MNSLLIIKKIEKYLMKKCSIERNIETITEIIEDIEDSTLLCYKLANNQTAIQKLEQKMLEHKPGLVFLFCEVIPKNDIFQECVFVDINYFNEVSAILIDNFFPESKKIKIAGVTGTNGKSTVVHLCRMICNYSSVKAASIGTLGVFVGDVKISETLNTTPGPIELAKILNELKLNYNTEYVFIEVSSHALEQDRLGPFSLECAGWTSFSRDHLDYHGTEENYFDAKTKVIHKLNANSTKQIITSFEEELLNQKLKERGIVATKTQNSKLPTSLFFKISYNIKNYQVAIGILSCLKINYNFDNFFDKLQGPVGRFEFIKSNTGVIIVDYAHSPDGLKSLLFNARQLYKDKKICIIFGCGGNRDSGKRSLMGNIADELADVIVITSDNPRDEDESVIAKMILAGIQRQKNVYSINDRKKAIFKGYDLLLNKIIDVLIVAGKGHEQYQEIKGRKLHFSDQLILKDLVEKYENI